MKYFRRKQKAPPELRICRCPIRERLYSNPREDGTCSRCSGHRSISLDELKVPYRDPSRSQ